MTIDAAPVLLDLAKTSSSEKYRVRALRGYIRIARQFTMTEPERIAMCQKALATATQPAEQKLVLEILAQKRYRSLETLRLAAKLTRDLPKLNKEATQTTLTIAREMGDEKHSATADEARDILAHAEARQGEARNRESRVRRGKQRKRCHEDAAKARRRHPVHFAAVTQLHRRVRRRSGPGTAKKLKIQYKIDGKSGDETFADNAIVILPMPK